MASGDGKTMAWPSFFPFVNRRFGLGGPFQGGYVFDDNTALGALDAVAGQQGRVLQSVLRRCSGVRVGNTRGKLRFVALSALLQRACAHKLSEQLLPGIEKYLILICPYQITKNGAECVEMGTWRRGVASKHLTHSGFRDCQNLNLGLHIYGVQIYPVANSASGGQVQNVEEHLTSNITTIRFDRFADIELQKARKISFSALRDVVRKPLHESDQILKMCGLLRDRSPQPVKSGGDARTTAALGGHQ